MGIRKILHVYFLDVVNLMKNKTFHVLAAFSLRNASVLIAALACVGCLLCGGSALGHVIISSPGACRYLKRHALPGAKAMRSAAAQAEKWSHRKVAFYVTTSKAISRVAHIPDAPYLTAIVGRRVQCVAATPRWFKGLAQSEQSWLWMVAIATLHQPRVYHMMLHAAENPPSGLFSGIEKWYGSRVSRRSVLSSERQAAGWLPPGKKVVAQRTVTILAHDTTFSANHWLPTVKEQLSAVRRKISR